jgi:magnesium transporter
VNLELIRGTFDNFSSLLSNKANEIMQVLTIIATIMMPLTFIAGVYGMNYRYMPELEMKYGYAWALGLMAVVAGLMLLWMKKKKWL